MEHLFVFFATLSLSGITKISNRVLFQGERLLVSAFVKYHNSLYISEIVSNKLREKRPPNPIFRSLSAQYFAGRIFPISLADRPLRFFAMWSSLNATFRLSL